MLRCLHHHAPLSRGHSRIFECSKSHILSECRDELRDDDIALRLNSIRRLGTIALALGPTRTRQELLPYLLESKPEEDELMAALAEELAGLGPMVGGAGHSHALVPLLEELARQDETVVRDAAVTSLQTLAKDFSGEQIQTHLVPAIVVRFRTGCSAGADPLVPHSAASVLQLLPVLHFVVQPVIVNPAAQTNCCLSFTSDVMRGLKRAHVEYWQCQATCPPGRQVLDHAEVAASRVVHRARLGLRFVCGRLPQGIQRAARAAANALQGALPRRNTDGAPRRRDAHRHVRRRAARRRCANKPRAIAVRSAR